MILYGGPKEVVLKQLECSHEWYGPCIDNVSRFFKCSECFALDRDLKTTEEWEEAEREEAERVARAISTLARHARGHWFESSTAHGRSNTRSSN